MKVRRCRSSALAQQAAGVRLFACARAMDVTSRYQPPTVRAVRRRAIVSVRRAILKVVYGSSIDTAATESGKPYSELPNAFRYRTELVAGCTCNGKDQIGLAPVKLENDPTLRKGDIVAGADGLMVTGRGADERGASLQMSPVSPSVQAKYERMPVVARE